VSLFTPKLVDLSMYTKSKFICFLWDTNLFPCSKGRTHIESVWEESADENIMLVFWKGCGCGKLRNEELHNLSSPSIVKWNQEAEVACTCLTHERNEKCTQHVNRKNQTEEQGIDGRMILKWILKRQDMRVWTALIWHKIGYSGALLWIRKWSFGFHKSWRLLWAAEGLSSTKKGACLHGISLVQLQCCLESRVWVPLILFLHYLRKVCRMKWELEKDSCELFEAVLH
jgi:hypothetical protein